MRFIKIAIAALLAAALLAACGPVKPASDLGGFLGGGVPFDLTDLSAFLSPSQLAELEPAIHAALADRGIDPARVDLQFDSPSRDSVKLPYANAGGLDLARLDTAALADHIAGQVAEEFRARGLNAVTSAGMTTTTTTATTSTSTKVTTTTAVHVATTKPTTTKKSGDLNPQTLELEEQDILKAADIASEYTFFGDFPGGALNLVLPANSKGETFMVHRDESYNTNFETTFRDGAKETIGFYKKIGPNKHQLVKTKTFTVSGGVSEAGYSIEIATDPRTYDFDGNGTKYYEVYVVAIGNNTGYPFTLGCDTERTYSPRPDIKLF